jgi:hypothetical protein
MNHSLQAEAGPSISIMHSEDRVDVRVDDDDSRCLHVFGWTGLLILTEASLCHSWRLLVSKGDRG